MSGTTAAPRPEWGTALTALRSLQLRPRLPDDPGLRLPPATDDAPLSATFLGASSILFRDEQTAVMTDGFFTRPSVWRMLRGRLATDPLVVDRCLQRAGVTELAAVVPLHTHYDHVLDAAAVCHRTGAMLVGSSSAAMVGRGGGLADDRILTPAPGRLVNFGRFTLTLFPSGHVAPPRLTGPITTPVVSPAPLSAYRMGDCYSLHVHHPAGAVLVQSSAGADHGALAGQRADVVYLAVGTLGLRPRAEFDAYWRDVVAAVQARRVLLTHWDDMTRPLSSPLVPMPYIADDLDVTLRRIRPAGNAAGVDVRIPTEWQPTDPLVDLRSSGPS